MSTKYLNSELSLEDRVEDLLGQLTRDDKFLLLSGHTNFTTNSIPRLANFGEFGMTDGPHGVGKHSGKGTKNTYFPATIGLAATWNSELAERFGKAVGEEVRAVGRHAILGPGLNICRSPLNGRTFEYLSEDPYLNGCLASKIVMGVQGQRIAACLKHFHCNNHESARRFSNSIVDERTLEEIYLRPFKMAIQLADPWMIMGSYNMINGKYIYENPAMLADKVCGEWGFKNLIVSDWLATHFLRDPAVCLKAKFTLEMPKAFVYKKDLLQAAYEKKAFSDAELDECIRRLLRVMFLTGIFDSADKYPAGSRNTPEHIQIAQQIAEESIVLLKNDKNVLPINKNTVKSVYIGGDLVNFHFYPMLWGGSSAVVPPTSSTIKKSLKQKLGANIQWVSDPQKADLAIVVTGWTHMVFNDSEGQDRKGLALSSWKVKKILKIAKKNPKTIVILYGGSACTMETWLDKVAAVLNIWQPHQTAGDAVANVLCGEVSPSGKLPITLPKQLTDTPTHLPKYPPGRTFPTPKFNLVQVVLYEQLFVNNSPKRNIKFDYHYDEGIYVGYRHYEKNKIEPLFPFGFGLSYTTFEYKNFKMDKKQASMTDTIKITAEIQNKGNISGAEIVQVYYHDTQTKIDRPEKELCGFGKIFLKPSESQTITIPIKVSDMQYYNAQTHHWTLEPSEITIFVGASSRDIKFSQNITVR